MFAAVLVAIFPAEIFPICDLDYSSRGLQWIASPKTEVRRTAWSEHFVVCLQRQGVHVSVISSLRSKPPIIADELRRQADTFIELDDLKAAIGRTLNAVPPRAVQG